MIEATTDILNKDVKEKCTAMGIDFYALEKSKRNTIAFISYREKKKVREFEVTFLPAGIFRISTRFLGYCNAIQDIGYELTNGIDPDGRRKMFSIQVNNIGGLNEIIMIMLDKGYSPNPSKLLV